MKKKHLDLCTKIAKKLVKQKREIIWITPDILEPLPITSIVKEYCKLYNYPCIIACTGKSALNDK